MQDFEGEKEPLNVDIFHNVIFDSLEKVKTFNDVSYKNVFFNLKVVFMKSTFQTKFMYTFYYFQHFNS